MEEKKNSIVSREFIRISLKKTKYFKETHSFKNLQKSS